MGKMTVGAAVYVQLLGSPRARIGEREILFAPDKRYQLLAYLAYQGDWVSREKLAFLFWPDTDSQNAKQNLRGLLQRVRALEWLSGLEADAHQVRWSIETDVAQLRDALAKGGIEATLSLYRGPLLFGLEGDEEGEFGDWLAMERESLHGRWRTAIFSGAHELETSKQHDASARLLHALIERDPLDEEGLQAYIRFAAQAGNKDQALSAYRAFTKHLQAELGMEPTSATQQLAQEIERAASMPPPSRETVISVEPVPVPKQTPPLTTATSLAPSLPKSATSFVGRDLELAEIMHLLSQEDCRLLTLTGAGGVGKTRLALQAAQELSRNYPDGVRFVPLDALASISSIPATLANVLGLELQGQEEPLAQVIRFLREKRALLVLDNFEHLLEGATLASELLQGCPNLKLLVTSRERLNLEEEWLLPVEGLGYPEDAGDLEKAPAHDAVQLFIQRAKRMQPNFAFTLEELPHVLEICRLVCGFPLGIELAAAWVRAVPVAEIAKEIGRDYDFLSSTSRNVKDRHRSIRAAFEHSWRLLSPAEQRVLRELSVFNGGFKKEAAVYVAGASYAVLAALVDKSLLRVSPDGRYDRHPLVYQYTQEKLIGQPEQEQAHEKHASYYLAFAEEAESHFKGAGAGASLERLEMEHDNLRSALRWMEERGREEQALRLTSVLGYFWWVRGPYREGREWLTRILKMGAARTAARAKALLRQGGLAHQQGDYGSAYSPFEESVAIYKELGNKRGAVLSLNGLGLAFQGQGDYASARVLFEQSLALANEVGDKQLMEVPLNNVGTIAQKQGDYTLAHSIFEEGLAIARETGDLLSASISLINLGCIAYEQGNYSSARSHLEQSLAILKGLGSEEFIFDNLETFAALIAAEGKFERAARLYGAVKASRERTGISLQSYEQARYEHQVKTVRCKLGEERFRAEWLEGRKMTIEEAVAYALTDAKLRQGT